MHALFQHRVTVPQKLGHIGASALAAFIFACIPASAFLSAQVPASPQTPETHHTAHRKPHRAASHSNASSHSASEAATKPAPPPAPDWPIKDPPAPPNVSWNNQQLHIDATNSSLQKILNDVSGVTGAKVEGLSQDQRVFGTFGPGRARDVLSQLLAGYGYNILMIGDNGQGVPRQVVLSARNTKGTSAVAPNPAQQDEMEDEPFDNQVDTQPQPPPVPEPGHQGVGADTPVRTPQQLMQEMQQRQQQLQQQQGQPNTPPTAPN